MYLLKKTHILCFLILTILAGCSGNQTTRPATKPTPPGTNNQTTVPGANSTTPEDSDTTKKPGGYYLDDGPDKNPPANLDAIPDAVPKSEPLLPRSNMPYKALGKIYYPMKIADNYKASGIASWYGKRFHGRKTSSGETYDMYAMTAAHPTLPLPSYVRVSNPSNGRSVIVRINDRGPFKHDRLIDLSYAAAYKLRLIDQGSGLVQVELMHPSQMNDNAASTIPAGPANTVANTSSDAAPAVNTATNVANAVDASATSVAAAEQYFVQVGAFKNVDNADVLLKKIQALNIEPSAPINHVYNNGLHRLKIGPYSTRTEAETIAGDLLKQLNLFTLILNQ